MQPVCNLHEIQAGGLEQHLRLLQKQFVDVLDNGPAGQFPDDWRCPRCKLAELQELMKTIEFPFYDDPKQQIESDYAPDTVKDLSELAQAFADDYPTQKLILKWIDGEAEYMAWEAQYLHFIEKLGYENFLIAMM